MRRFFVRSKLKSTGSTISTLPGMIVPSESLVMMSASSSFSLISLLSTSM